MERLSPDRMFVAVIETGSFRRAAARLGTTSLLASKLVSNLESELGVQLLKRTTRALMPTESGDAYYEGIKRILDELDMLNASTKNTSNLATGRLRVAAPHSFGAAQLFPALIEFAQIYPDIELDVSLTDRVVNLIDERFDAAIRIGKPTDSTLIASKLCDVRTVVAASPEYLQSHGVPLCADDLLGHDCIIDTTLQDPSTWRFKGPSGTAGALLTVSGRLHFPDAEACLAAAKAGLGVTRLPSFIAGPSFQDGSLVPVLDNFEDHPAALFTLYPSRRHLAVKVRVLVDFLSKRYQGTPFWDRGWLTKVEEQVPDPGLIASNSE